MRAREAFGAASTPRPLPLAKSQRSNAGAVLLLVETDARGGTGKLAPGSERPVEQLAEHGRHVERPAGSLRPLACQGPESPRPAA